MIEFPKFFLTMAEVEEVLAEKREEDGETTQTVAVPPQGEKWCGGCKQNVPLAAFHKNKRGKFGRDSWCKSCKRRRYKEMHG